MHKQETLLTRESENDTQANATPLPQPHKQTTRWKAFGIGLGLTVALGGMATLLAPLPGLAIIGSLTVALLLGLLWRSTLGLPAADASGIKFSAQKVLRYGIILTGVRLNFTLIASSGVKVLLLDGLLITFGMLAVPWIAHKLGLSRGLAFLLGVGQSICGASAVGAMAALRPDIEDNEVSLAVAICGLVGTIGVLFFTFGIHLVPFFRENYGLLTGSTLHEIAQVVAAGPVGGASATDLALVVKLTRVMLLAPVAVIAAAIFTLRKERSIEQGEHRRFDWNKVPIPWFVFGFLAVGALNSLGLFPKGLANSILQASVFLMVVAMAAMGLMVDLRVIRQTGIRALGVAMLLLLVFVAVSSLLIVVLSHI